MLYSGSLRDLSKSLSRPQLSDSLVSSIGKARSCGGDWTPSDTEAKSGKVGRLLGTDASCCSVQVAD